MSALDPTPQERLHPMRDVFDIYAPLLRDVFLHRTAMERFDSHRRLAYMTSCNDCAAIFSDIWAADAAIEPSRDALERSTSWLDWLNYAPPPENPR